MLVCRLRKPGMGETAVPIKKHQLPVGYFINYMLLIIQDFDRGGSMVLTVQLIMLLPLHMSTISVLVGT